ncbi:MAG: DegT/DnrJ/EryC1/StrS family aminotransferase [Candidatus Thiodiazotropha sp.]
MSRYLSPTGSPILTRELLAWFGSVLSGTDHSDTVKSKIAEDLQLPHGLLYNTGRAAMASLLTSVKQLRSSDDDRDEIIVPAYTCYSVASSAMNAGLKIRLCDIDPVTLSYDWDSLSRLNTDRVLAMVSANLYGLPNDLPALERFAQAHDIHLIDDAAQALYARVGGRLAGTFGLAGILSFDKGKNVTSLQGGMVVTGNPELYGYLDLQQQKLSSLGFMGNLKEFLKVIVYYAFLHPVMYQIPANVSFSGLGETRFEDQVAVHGYPAMLSSLVKAQLERAESITAARATGGRDYDQALQPTSLLGRIEPVETAEPVYLRYPVLVRDAQCRAHLLESCRHLGVSASYPKALSQLVEIRHSLVGEPTCPGAEAVAAQVVTLPTHAYVRSRDRADIIKCLQEICH